MNSIDSQQFSTICQSYEYNVGAFLANHGFHSEMDTQTATQALSGKPAYTYVIYPRLYERGCMQAFVNSEGEVEHHPITLLNSTHYIWRNMSMPNIGTLDEVLTTMMYGNKGQPL